MSKIKEKLLNNITQEELERELFYRYEDEYREWLESDDYIDWINEQLAESAAIFSIDDINNSMKYASNMITIEPSEVGKEVYDKLFSEKVNEYLNETRYIKY